MPRYYQAVIERDPYQMRTVVELIDPPHTLRIGGTFTWGAVNGLVRITGLAPRHIRPSSPKNVCVTVVCASLPRGHRPPRRRA